jgi:hypothetical protein
VPIALVDPALTALVEARADDRGGLGLDELLEDPLQVVRMVSVISPALSAANSSDR